MGCTFSSSGLKIYPISKRSGIISSSAATVSADFRGKAKYAVTTEKDQSISVYVPYEVVGATVDGKSVNYSVGGNIAKVSVPAGTHTVQLKVIGAVEYLWGHESGSGKALYDENGVLTYKYWKDIDGTEYLYEDGQLKIDAYYDLVTKLLVREELLENGDWQITCGRNYQCQRYGKGGRRRCFSGGYRDGG